MHDLLEGVCVYVMQPIIYKFIFEKKYFTLQFLNCRIKNFDYGPTERADRPPQIYFNSLKSKMKLKMSASEMLCFVRYFALIIGHIIPEDDEYWPLYMYLRQIIAIVTSPRTLRYHAKMLKNLIQKHHELYMKLFKTTLKPKFHNMIHYPQILLENGPIVHFWSMRYEARHRQIKPNAQSTSCIRNLLKTIATKQLLKLCEVVNTAKYSNNNITLKSTKDNDKEININGFAYQIGTFVVTNMDEMEKEFGETIEIFVENDGIYFYMKIYCEITFDDHCHAYIVSRKNCEFKKFKQTDLPVIAPCLSVKLNDNHFIASKYIL